MGDRDANPLCHAACHRMLSMKRLSYLRGVEPFWVGREPLGLCRPRHWRLPGQRLIEATGGEQRVSVLSEGLIDRDGHVPSEGAVARSRRTAGGGAKPDVGRTAGEQLE